MLREALVWGRSCWEHERLSTALVVSGLGRQSPESSAEKVGWGWRGVAWRAWSWVWSGGHDLVGVVTGLGQRAWSWVWPGGRVLVGKAWFFSLT